MVASTIAAACLVLLAGCGGESRDPGPSRQGADAKREEKAAPGPERELPRVRCPPDLVECEEAAGRIAYVERVDPDGDGDAHFVLLSRDGITAPGITVVDVRSDLRPDPLPRPGDLLAAAGPVYPGSYGQRQIEAVAVRTSR